MSNASAIALKTAESLIQEIEQLHEAISRRAYDLFRQQGDGWSDPVKDWLEAERELVSKPAIEVRRKNGAVEIVAAVPGIEAKDLDVQITPEDVLIKGTNTHQHTARDGDVSACEFSTGQIFRSIHLPEAVNPDTAKAQLKNGMLAITASIKKSNKDGKVGAA
jgi:HSP20 family molecular chaperone IbpA